MSEAALTTFALFIRRWLSLAMLLVVAAALVLGFWGWCLADPPHSLSQWFNAGFRTLQLLTFQFPRDPRSLDLGLPWQLNLARFVLPLAALAGSYRFLLRAVTNPTRLALLGLQRGHVVIVPGKGGVGQALLREAAAQQMRAVVIAPDLLANERARMEEYRLPILPADPFDEATWHQVRADRADLVVVAHGSDIDNLNIVVTAATAFAGRRRRRRQPPPLLVSTIENEALAEQVDLALDSAARRSALRYRRLSVAEETARTLFLDPPLPMRKAACAEPARIAIIGLGQAARAVLWQALTLGQDAAAGGPFLTIIAPERELAATPLLQQGVIPSELATLTLIPCDLSASLPEGTQAHLLAPAPLLACVCLPDDAAVSIGMALARAAAIGDTPELMVAVHQSREDRFLTLLAHEAGQPGHARLRAFGGILPQGALQRLRDERGELLPRAVHMQYQALLQRLNPSGGTPLDWDALPETLRHANRAAADHIVVKLAAIGCRPTPGQDGDFAFNEAEIAALARIEHRRWWADRLLRGWRVGPRDNDRRLHPDMIPFDSLDADGQEKDRDAIRHIPEIIALAGQSIQRDGGGLHR